MVAFGNAVFNLLSKYLFSKYLGSAIIYGFNIILQEGGIGGYRLIVSNIAFIDNLM